MAKTVIGKVTHYFEKIKVVIILLEKGDVKIGDTITFVTKSGEEFTQKVESMQIEHANIDIAKSGDEFGLKTDFKVKAGTDVVKS